MARDEQDREDLMAEATALVQRASIQLPGLAAESVVGFRRDGSLALYLAADRVYQFTSSGQLRRAFVDRLLYKARDGRLVSLDRRRSTTEVALVSHELDEVETQAFLTQMHEHVNHLRQCVASGNYELLAEIPPGAQVLRRTLDWLDQRDGEFAIARSPRSA